MLLALFSAGCPSAPPSCPGERLGDPTATPELVPAALALDSSGILLPLTDQSPLDLVRPIQGGHVLFAGAFVRNVNGCNGSLRGELRREGATPRTPGPIVVFDERSVDLVPVGAGEKGPAGQGWGRPPADVANTANIPACPDVQDFDIVGGTFWLQMTYTEASGRKVQGQVQVVPTCRQNYPDAQALCKCECQARYTIERCLK